MLKPLAQSPSQASSLLFPCRSRMAARETLSLPRPLSSSLRRTRARRGGQIRCSVSEEPQTLETATKEPVTVKAVATVKQTVGGVFAHIESHLDLDGARDDLADLFGKSIFIELISSELDPKTGLEKEPIQAYARKSSHKHGDVNYEADFKIPATFGKIGAVVVTNEHHTEMYLAEIVLTRGDEASAQTITCKSWIHSKFDNPADKRVFFTNKSYLPGETPKGLVRLREEELKVIRGNGEGERKSFERIYDYDVYNDLANPDQDIETARPVLGGNQQYPYPRRCRTGRPRTKKDPNTETRKSNFYVPRDETFSEVKQATFSAKTLRSVLKALIPTLESSVIDKNLRFPYFTAIDSLYDEGIPLPKQEGAGLFRTVIPRLIKAIDDMADDVLLFEPPAIIDKDKFSWFRDEEFARQTLAGLNPLSIQLITEFPLVSKLDPAVYGPPESEITEELIEREIKGVMTVKEALKQRRLFMLDYHDIFLPYVHKVRALEDKTLYGSRTVFFLTPDGTLRPIAIELTRPASPTAPQWKKAYTHTWDATGTWLWRLAKSHVVAHDSGFHQLVSHWLRTHACTEPYIIAANRQLSAMHPIYRLLHPHFRYTMEINALARESLINATGIIETSFAPGKYAIELSAVAYGALWRFDREALPADLIHRGLAIEDPSAEHGLQLTIKDYPYANDGLLIWSSIKEWVADYVAHYYPSSTEIIADTELQAFWTEVRTVGHGDKKDEPWWLAMDSADNLIHILTTIIWVTSGHHAAVNFGQYHYAGYFPNRPTISRQNMPDEDEANDEWPKFLAKPERSLMKTFPSQIQATTVMAVLDVLSNHAPDEEYLGENPEAPWADEPLIAAAFEKFNGRMRVIDGIIDERNLDAKLMNRCGAGIVPYELLKPFSQPGVTGMGIPNSISI